MAKERSAADTMRILKEAKERFERVKTWEGKSRTLFTQDLKFAEGDSDNNWQWPDDIRKPRETDARPMLTINKTRQHNLDVLNDARQSKVGVKIIPTGDHATYESAQAYMGVVRSIEYRSNADTAYQTALAFAVKAGIGYWRLLTDYVHEDTFDQEIIIRRVKDPLLVYLDPDINEFDGSDANWGFVSGDGPTKQLEKQYPDLKGRMGNSIFGDKSWVMEGKTRFAEYWRRVPKMDTLVSWINPTTDAEQIARLSTIPKLLRPTIMADKNTRTRQITSYKVECFKIIGDEIVEETEWLGIYIPIVRVIGEETVIEGVLDRKGHTRALKDAQRMFNYNASGFVEHGALQTKTPWTAPIEAIEDYLESYWKTANTQNHSVLPYNAFDEKGEPIPFKPERAQPPTGSPLYLEGMNSAAEWMRMVSGQYQADMGAPGNERSGVAIQQRQRQGDNATYHYLDHQALAVRFTGKILIDLIPKVYNTARVLKYKGEDGSENEVHIDPNQKEAVTTEDVGENEKKIILNPNVGKYDVESDVGPSFATKRQEAFAAYTQILAQNKELTALIGDIALQYADFPGADEAAERLRRMVPPQALDSNANPEVTALQSQLDQAQKFIQMLAEKLKDKNAELNVKREANSINQEKNALQAYDSQSKRLTAIKEALGLDPQGLMILVKEVIAESIATSASGAATEGALDVPKYSEMPEAIPQAMGGPADDQPPPQPAAAPA